MGNGQRAWLTSRTGNKEDDDANRVLNDNVAFETANKLYVGVLIMLIFGEALALYGLIVALILTQNSRYYFLLDAAGAAIAFAVHQVAWFYPILILQQWQHIFYFSTWDKSAAAKRVISWSSLDWDRGRWNQVDLVLGTAFDMGVRMANTYFIGAMLSYTGIITAVIITIILYQMAILGSRFAWASKSSMPEWVAKRIKPLSSEQRQEVQWMDQMIMKE